MEPSADFQPVFDWLKQILQEYTQLFQVKVDEPGAYSLDTHFSKKYGKDLLFGAVKIQKHYVSYYLFPVYMFPDLLTDISPALKKHMQGKSCFNFTTVDETLFNELSCLTRASFERARQENLP
jgi:hypothetical protein